MNILICIYLAQQFLAKLLSAVTQYFMELYSSPYKTSMLFLFVLKMKYA